jgi:hypothetical protein
MKDIKWVGGGYHHYEGGNTVVSSILPFPFVFVFKETEVSQKQSHYVIACTGGRVL